MCQISECNYLLDIFSLKIEYKVYNSFYSKYLPGGNFIQLCGVPTLLCYSEVK